MGEKLFIIKRVLVLLEKNNWYNMKWPDITNLESVADFFRQYGLWILIGVAIMIIYSVLRIFGVY